MSKIKKHNDKTGKILVGAAIGLSAIAVPTIIYLVLRKQEPVKGGTISSGYGYRNDPFNPTGPKQFHNGFDISAKAGTPIKSIMSGTVTKTGYDNVNGYYVMVKHQNYSTFCGHMLKPALVKKGDKVRKGKKIGLVGSTGMSTGPHVHFILYNKNLQHINPGKLLKS